MPPAAGPVRKPLRDPEHAPGVLRPRRTMATILAMARTPPALFATLRRLAVFAWMAVAAQAVGVPIHLAAEEHYHGGHAGDHVHFGPIGHAEHHARHHRDAHAARHAADARDAHDAHGGTGAPAGAGTDCSDESGLPPHSALDHLVDGDRPRRVAEADDDELDGDEGTGAALATAPEPSAPLSAPRRCSALDRPPDRAPAKAPARRPEQARAPPSVLV